MTYQEKYSQAKKAGYTDEEIMEHLGATDPSFEEKMTKAQEAGYTPQEVLSHFNAAPKQKEEGMIEHYGKDVLKQSAQGFGVGALGTYGDILDLLHLQAKEMLPNEKAKYEREAEILDKARDKGGLSPSEIRQLSATDESSFLRLPSSEDVEKKGKQFGIVSEPKTEVGRYARRIGKLGGGGASLGASGIVAPIVAGTAGQTLEELGAPPWAQAAAEIIASLKFAPKTNIPITSKSKEVEKVLADLRKAGYSEQDITLAKSALEERKILKKYASLTPKAENTINQGIKNSEALFKEQIKKGLPGYAEGGLPYLEKTASNVYQAMEELASKVPIKNTEPVKKAVEDAIAYLEKYPLLDEQKKFIEFMKDGLNKLQGKQNVGKLAKPGEVGLTAEFFTGFYRNLGKAGNWGDPSQKEHLLGLVKEGIKETFAKSGPEGAKFGKIFEKTNEAWKHWLNTRDLMETIEKAQNVNGMNFKKISNILNEPKNHELAKKVLGHEQLENIKSITKGAEAIESLLKQIPEVDKTSKAIKTLEGVRALMTGDFRTLAAIIGIETAKMISTKLLIDPKKQNTMKKLIIAAKNNSRDQAVILAQELFKEDDAQAKEAK